MPGLFEGPIFEVAVLLLLSKFGRPRLLRDFDLIIFLIFFFTRDLKRCDLRPEPRPEVLLWNLRSLDNWLFSPLFPVRSPVAGLNNSRLLIRGCPSVSPLIQVQPEFSIIIITSDHTELLMVSTPGTDWPVWPVSDVTWTPGAWPDSSDPDQSLYHQGHWGLIDIDITWIILSDMSRWWQWRDTKRGLQVNYVCLTYFMLHNGMWKYQR